MNKLILILTFSLFRIGNSVAQAVDTNIMGMQFTMDEVVIKSAKNGWDLAGFIRRMKEDTTFYKAFLGLRILPYTSDNDIFFYDNKDNIIAQLENRTVQTMNANCRSVAVVNEKVKGNYYDRKKEPRFFTATLFQNLFFRSRANECGQTDIIALQDPPRGRIEHSKEQLKQLIFNPGSKVDGIPFVGKKASVFENEGVQQRYDFRLKFVQYQGEECYFFQAIPKEAYRSQVVFNQLDTWFRVSDFSIVARDYALSYSTLLYDFDVAMKVRLEKVGERLLPSSIDYKGNWHIFSKKRERASFRILFDY
ncbi:MAG: hypothetical protein IT256_07445 [Chitinophagaceae bacterium]|nr:hypothetical protein [Chitinophagaceae bacterium]